MRSIKWFVTSALLLLTGLVQAGAIVDTPILGGRLLVANDGHVQVQLLDSEAWYLNTLYLETPSDWGKGQIFNNRDLVDGGVIDLGEFTAGTELIFRMYVGDTQQNFFSGDSSRNSDGLAHALAVTMFEDGIYSTVVGFEDLMHGGDEDFDDLFFRLTNVIDPLPSQPASAQTESAQTESAQKRSAQPAAEQPVSAPPVLLLFITGLLLLGRFVRRAARG